MRIESINCRNMWSFGENAILIENPGQHNVIIGKNNTGKSKFLAAIAWIQANSAEVHNAVPFSLAPDVYFEDGSPDQVKQFYLYIRVALDEREVQTVVAESERELQGQNDPLSSLVRGYVRSVVTFGCRSIEESPKQSVGSVAFADSAPVDFSTVLKGKHQEFETTSHRWLNQTTRVIHKHTLLAIGRSIKYISGWRTLRAPNEEKRNIIQDLHVWKAPPQKDKHLRYIFDRVERLFQRLMLRTDIGLVPEHNGEHLSLTCGGRYLPIESFGDGVQHLLMVAFHLATSPRSVLLLEEPETHIHPQLQRNLMKVLGEELRGQSFTTTHSPVLLDSSLASTVFRVEHDNRCSTVSPCNTSPDLYRVLDLLDVRASDILQANFVIWVEGPTDRMFLSRCFELLKLPITEGQHYQITYYGGRLRSHCTFDELQPELVNLLRLCRHTAMVCDSDRRDEADDLDESKARLAAECEKMGGLSWVTDGREIENYFPDAVLSAAFASLLEKPGFSITLHRYKKISDVLHDLIPEPEHGQGWKVNYEDNKARVMPELLKHLTASGLDRWGLKEKLLALVERIKGTNGCGMV
jgi:energy-coupling factor transporter ATP-binding protein EcfA2